MSYRIIPLSVGHFDALPKQTCMYRMCREETYVAPSIMWYIEGTKNNVIVDLGPPGPALCLQNHGLVMTRTEAQEPVNALSSIGLSPDDVKLVILTHLHWDHAWGFSLFKNAKFLVQRKEMAYAIAPLPSHRPIYYETSLGKPQFVDYLESIETISGDLEIEDGLHALLIPSHTPGSQGVLVKTEKGRYFIAGDAVGLFECWEATPHIPSGIFTNLEDYYESMDKIEKNADYVLPGHDGRVFDRPFYP